MTDGNLGWTINKLDTDIVFNFENNISPSTSYQTPTFLTGNDNNLNYFDMYYYSSYGGKICQGFQLNNLNLDITIGVDNADNPIVITSTDLINTY